MNKFDELLPILESKQMNSNEKVLYLYLLANLDMNGLCQKPNKTIAKFFDNDVRTLQMWLSKLKSKNLIDIYYNSKTGCRVIEPTFGKVKSQKVLQFKPMLYENQEQKNLTEEQERFLKSFQTYCPDKKIDCQITQMPEVDYEKLMMAIKKSPQYLMSEKTKNLGLKWCLEHAKEIINNNYIQYQEKQKSNFSTGRNYTKEEINGLFQKADEIEI